jgi:hypothetical protein
MKFQVGEELDDDILAPHSVLPVELAVHLQYSRHSYTVPWHNTASNRISPFCRI